MSTRNRLLGRAKKLQEAIELLSGLHPCLTVDDDNPIAMAEAIFAHVQAEKTEMTRRIDQLQRSILSGHDAERLADLLENPPAPNEALTRAAQRYRETARNCVSLESVIAEFEADPEMSKVMQQVRAELRQRQDVIFTKLCDVAEAAAAIDEMGADVGCRNRLAEMARSALRFMRNITDDSADLHLTIPERNRPPRPVRE